MAADHLPGLAPDGPFQMQTLNRKGNFDGRGNRYSSTHWEPMEDGPGGHVWKPRPTALAAAAKCLAWAGVDIAHAICIPAMRVVDLSTGEQVWRSGIYEGGNLEIHELGDAAVPPVGPAAQWGDLDPGEVTAAARALRGDEPPSD